MIIKVLLQAETRGGSVLWQPREIGAVSAATYSEAQGRLPGLFRDLAATDWSVDHGADSGCGGNCEGGHGEPVLG